MGSGQNLYRFTIDAEGHLTEERVRRVVEAYRAEFPWIDGTALEAALTVAWAQSLLAATAAPLLERFGLSLSRFNVLRVLHQAPERRLPMNEIAAGLYVTATNVTKLVAGLERDGLVSRRPDESDRRVLLVALTPEGEARLQAAIPEYLEHTAAMWRGLTGDEQRTVAHLLAKFRMTALSRPRRRLARA